MTAIPIYEASPLKRARATKAEMEERAEFLIAYASEHGPVTVRGLYYQAEVASLPGISKDDKDYAKVQRQVLKLRREGRLSYSDIADATRWMRKPTTHGSVEEALRNTAQFYRKALSSSSKSPSPSSRSPIGICRHANRSGSQPQIKNGRMILPANLTQSRPTSFAT